MKNNEPGTFSEQLNALILLGNGTIKFNKNQISINKKPSSEKLNQLFAVLSATDCPQGLLVNLMNNQIGAEGAKVLAEVLTMFNYPQSLSINLWNNNIRAEGAKALAKVLESGKCPQGLSVTLGYNNIGDDGAKALAKALESGKCPQGLSVILGYNNIGDDGAKALAKALESGKCPQGLSINLWGNKIGDEGAKALAKALESGNCPKGLSINLEHNDISSKAIDGLLKALSGNYAVHNLKISGLSDKQSKLLDSYLKRNRELTQEEYRKQKDFLDLPIHYEQENPLNHLIQHCLKHIEESNWQQAIDLLKNTSNKELLNQSLSNELLIQISPSFSIIEQNNKHNTLESLKIIERILEDKSVSNIISLSPKQINIQKVRINNLIEGFLQKDEQEKEEKRFNSEYTSTLKGENRHSLFNPYLPPKLLSSLSPNLEPKKIIEILNDEEVKNYLTKNNLQISPEIQKKVETYNMNKNESSSIIKNN